jgi:two-component system chemotaxis response regulator CheB
MPANPPTALVVVGASLGGLEAVGRLLADLPAGFPLPVVIAQHRPHESGLGLAAALARRAQWPITQPVDKDPVIPGHVYVAPPDYHLLIEDGHFALSTAPPVNFARPSIDVLFESATEAFGPGVIAVVLTGANHDGARGAARVKARGGRVLVQDPATAESPAMPAAALAAVPDALVRPLPELAAALARAATQPPPAADASSLVPPLPIGVSAERRQLSETDAAPGRDAATTRPPSL